MLFFVVFHYFLALLLGLSFIYTFQIKEYRFDRFLSIAKEVGYVHFLYLSKIRFPAVTFRNILLVFIHLMITSLLFLYSFEQAFLFEFLSRTFFLAPITSFLIIAIGVFITSIPSKIIRSIIRFQAIHKVKNTHAIFIGITGSYGKTSIKEHLAHILSAKYHVAKTPKNMNTDVGIALSINRLLSTSTQFFITELGAYRSGELHHASSYIPFQYIILSGLGNQHLDLYGSKEALIKEETSPIYSLSPNGKAYLNIASVQENDLDISQVPSITFGASDEAKIQLKDIKTSPDGTHGIIVYKNQVFQIQTRLLGIHSLENLLPAVALSYDLGMDIALIEKQISTIKPLYGKLSKHKGYNNATILHDGMNTNLNGFLAAIDVMNKFSHKKKIIITKGIIELGVEKRSSYNMILQKMNNTGIKLFTTDRLFNTIKSSVEINTFNDVISMQKKILPLFDSDTLILIEGIFTKPVLDIFIFSQHDYSCHNK